MSWGTFSGEQKVETEIETKPRQHAPAMRFENINALVSGAGRGFGSLITVAFAKDGANVVVDYNNSKEGAQRFQGHKCLGEILVKKLLIKRSPSM